MAETTLALYDHIVIACGLYMELILAELVKTWVQ